MTYASPLWGCNFQKCHTLQNVWSNIPLCTAPYVFFQGVIIEKEEQERQKRHADQADDRIEAILNKVQSLEKSIIKLMEALKIKS